MPDTLSFHGDAVTFLGLAGITATFVALVWIYRSFWNSPYRK